MRTFDTDVRGPSVTVLRLAVLALAAVSLGLAGCDSEPVGLPHAISAQVQVQGEVTDPTGAGLADAAVTFTLHETPSCSSPVLETSTLRTRADGSYAAGPALTDVDEDFEPREVCLEVRAEPPEARPDLAPAEKGGFVVTLRTNFGTEPVEEIEVDLTLSAADGG